MTTPTRLAVFHYHLLPGGVTNVVFLSLKALIHHHPDITEILLVVGTAENAGTVAERLRKEVQSIGRDIHVGVSVIPEIGYTTPDEAESIHRQGLIHRLVSDYGGYLWWVHNYHLGKNPVFTAALIEAVTENPSQPALFHIHDFPEDGRHHNLIFLHHFAGSEVYPLLPNVRYAVINSRDLDYLKAAGLPEEILFLLNDPLELRTPPEADREDIRQRLNTAFGRDFPAFDPARPLWLYPVRTIRRKNALEAALICRAAGANLLLTLPGVSRQEKPYSELVEGLFRRGVIPGLWGIGRHLDAAGIGFTALAASADTVISSSVQEGFGYLFADAVQWGRPLVARYLDILDGIRDIFNGHPAYFYDSLPVPLTDRQARVLKERYTRRAAGMGCEERVDTFLEGLSGGTVDFAALHVELQAELLENTRDPAFLRDLRGLNEPFLQAIKNMPPPPDHPDRRVFDRFGPEAFFRVFENITSSFGSVPGKPGTSNIQKNLVDRFARADILRILYEYQG